MNQGIKFSEIGQLSGIHQTEWSWSPLMADFDNDGNKDVMITNGFPKDITDKDFANYRADVGNVASNRLLLDSIPVIKIPSYAFRNNGDLTFKDVTKQWGIGTPSFSNGAVFADLDNDGDLDYVVNNINDKAFIYENTLYQPSQKRDTAAHFLRVILKGSENNRQALGAKVTVYQAGKLQCYEQNVYRGFLSSVEEIPHFGLGRSPAVDSVVIDWPDGSHEVLADIKPDQVITATFKKGPGHKAPQINRPLKRFEKIDDLFKPAYVHKEEDKIDYNVQRTIPHKFSQSGPSLSVGDINKDGLEDIIIGGSANHHTSLYEQRKDGSFVLKANAINNDGKMEEDEGMLLFDADNDGDLDLYTVSGSIESMDSLVYQDRLYKNNGNGIFKLDRSAVPAESASGSCVRAADFDLDGDLDLFVGGRVVPGKYPLPPKSFILRNDHGKFTDITQEVGPLLSTIGMVTDGLWSDFNNDGRPDLVVAGEFMALTFLRNEGNKLITQEDTGVSQYTGWWSSLAGGDFDNDGDIDYIGGNLGLNNNFQVRPGFPLKVFAKDFDGNGSIDPVLACYQRESMEADARKLYPIHFWDELNSQSPKFRNKFSRYRQYSKVTMDEVLTADDLKGAIVLEATQMGSGYIENLGNGKFAMKSLPILAQVAPINGIQVQDVNRDGNLDVVMIGNDYGNEVFAGRYDAFTGLVLIGNGKGSFEVLPSAASGVYTTGDAKALVNLYNASGNSIWIASQNKDKLIILESTDLPDEEVIDIGPMDNYAIVSFTDGREQRIEFYYGSGYLSQSTRMYRIPPGVKEIVIYDYKGKSRKIAPVSI